MQSFAGALPMFRTKALEVARRIDMTEREAAEERLGESWKSNIAFWKTHVNSPWT